MQPLVSPVDHESRQNTYRREEAEGVEGSSERVPLMTRQYIRDPPTQRTSLSTIIITLMAVVVILGVAIAVYLLIEQEHWMPKEAEDWELDGLRRRRFSRASPRVSV